MSKQANVFPSLFHYRSLTLFVILLLAGSRLPAQVQAPPQAPGPSAGSGNFIITFRPGTSQADRAASVRRAGAALRFNYSIVDAVAVTVPNVNVYVALQRDPSILQIIPDRVVRAHVVPQDEVGENAKPGGGGGGGSSTGQIVPEGVQRVGPHTPSSDGTGVGVAILDTGMDLVHADLQEGALAAQKFDAFDPNNNCKDQQGHGTHVAGIVGARNNSIAVVGVAPKVTLYCGRVLDQRGNGTDSTVMEGLDWVGQIDGVVCGGSPEVCSAANNTIQVVNMSLGREGSLDDNPALRRSVEKLYKAGIVVVVSAGNDRSLEVSQNVPATYPEVLAVASTTAINGSRGCGVTIAADTASWFTTDGRFDDTALDGNAATGIGVTISAPGEDKENVNKGCLITSVGILSLKKGGGTTRMQGTSMSAPHVSGVAARLIQAGLSGVETIRDRFRLGTAPPNADRKGIAPLNAPVSGYSFDGEREGIAKAP